MNQKSDISEILNKKLDKFNFANIFKIVDLGKNSYYNISKTIFFRNTDDVTDMYYDYYEPTQLDTWTNISYKFYGTIKLWWLICKFNDITDPFNDLIPGKLIKIPKQFVANQLVQALLNTNPY